MTNPQDMLFGTLQDIEITSHDARVAVLRFGRENGTGSFLTP